MGKLYLSTDVTALADRLINDLDVAARRDDLFTPTTIVVPNHYLKKWLRLRLARRFGVAINLRFSYLEDLCWDLLRELDGRHHVLPVELLSDDAYRLMILAVLLDARAGGEALSPLRDYLGHGDAVRRDFCRRAWHLSVRLADLLREYEFHRRDVILHWLRNEDAYPHAGADGLRLERSQKELFRLIVREPGGLRALLGRAADKVLKTLPQYAGEIMELPSRQLATPQPRTVHVFGIAQVSAFHHLVLRFLGAKYDIRIYQVNPLLGRLTALPKKTEEAHNLVRGLAARYRGGSTLWSTAETPGDNLLELFGLAGADGLCLMADVLTQRRAFQGEILAPPARPDQSTVLRRVQEQLVGRTTASTESGGRGSRRAAGAAAARLAESRALPKTDATSTSGPDPAPVSNRLRQDPSLQIVACPGVYREVETVYQSILDNLQHDATLRQTDVAVLVTDMTRYRPVLQAVFERPPRRLAFNLAEFTAAGQSAFGHGVLGLLDLALESFTRSRVFAVLLNPCFLARLGLTHAQALTWLDWAEALGVYHAWDRADKRERGYADSALYSWQLGLRRLRLGRLMDIGADGGDGPAPRFQEVIPFADLASGDKEQLDTFCRAVEGLLPRLFRLRSLQTTGEIWTSELRRLIADFLTVPADRLEDEKVRDELLASLVHLRILDPLPAQSGQPPTVSLALVREYVEHVLAALEGTTGDYLTGGVTISGLAPLRAVPFRIIYILGLGEGLFPGSNATSVFDLRSRERRDGDVRPADANRFLFLEALLAAQSKMYLLYNCRELQRDQALQPCSAVTQLRRHVEQHILGGEPFQEVTVPLRGDDPLYFSADANGPHTDAVVNYNMTDRLLAIAQAQRNGDLRLDTADADEVEQRLRAAQRSFALPPPPVGPLEAGSPSPREEIPTISLRELRGFLDCPAEAALKRHLGLYDEEEIAPADDEPFITDSPIDFRLMSEFLRRFVNHAVTAGIDVALAQWRDCFAELHLEWRLRGRVPEEAFGAVDQVRLAQMLQQRIEGVGGLAAFLRQRHSVPFCGPMLLGETVTPIGPRTRFPALRLELSSRDATGDLPASVRLVGVQPFAWRSDDAFEMLVLSNYSARRVPRDQLSLPLLEPLLFLVALRAGSEARPGALASGDWLDRRDCHVHVAHNEGIASFVYLAEDLPGDDAAGYLTALVRDFLDRSSFDLLPFDLLVAETRDKLRLAYTLPEDDDHPLDELRSEYDAMLTEAVLADQEKGDHATYRPMRLMEIVTAAMPAGAFEKVRRRFRLLDRGPARLRNRQRTEEEG